MLNPAQRLKYMLEDKFTDLVTFEQNENILNIYFVRQNVKIKLRVVDKKDHITVQFGSLWHDIERETSVLVEDIKKRVAREVNKRGGKKEDIAKEARSIVPESVLVRRDGNLVGFFVNQDKAIAIAELLKSLL